MDNNTAIVARAIRESKEVSVTIDRGITLHFYADNLDRIKTAIINVIKTARK